MVECDDNINININKKFIDIIHQYYINKASKIGKILTLNNFIINWPYHHTQSDLDILSIIFSNIHPDLYDSNNKYQLLNEIHELLYNNHNSASITFKSNTPYINVNKILSKSDLYNISLNTSRSNFN